MEEDILVMSSTEFRMEREKSSMKVETTTKATSKMELNMVRASIVLLIPKSTKAILSIIRWTAKENSLSPTAIYMRATFS
jgi:hypothetical protein